MATEEYTDEELGHEDPSYWFTQWVDTATDLAEMRRERDALRLENLVLRSTLSARSADHLIPLN